MITTASRQITALRDISVRRNPVAGGRTCDNTGPPLWGAIGQPSEERFVSRPDKSNSKAT